MPKSSTKLQRTAPELAPANSSNEPGSTLPLQVMSAPAKAGVSKAAARKNARGEKASRGRQKDGSKKSVEAEKVRRRQRRNFSLPIDEALRFKGMDEIEYAVMLACFIDLALANRDAKLMLDGLKEWARQLEVARGASASSGTEPPTVVQLVHAVPRPGSAPA